MDNQNRENLKELVERFFEAEQAGSCIEDFRKAEQILREHPAPSPDDMLLADIKAEIAMRLPARRARLLRHKLWEAAGIAATIAVLALFGTQLFDKPSEQPAFRAALIPAAIWESNNIAADDADLAVFSTEIEQINDELTALESGEDTTDADSTIAELEMELIEINSDFWKG
ncbi:MAG: hypothetical protein JSW66_15725 [Phycisphaerales bacterium]|nr:MAG: hypothetical protein JSW66_15725 [Phycisphaerales bacterium]